MRAMHTDAWIVPCKTLPNRACKVGSEVMQRIVYKNHINREKVKDMMMDVVGNIDWLL